MNRPAVISPVGPSPSRWYLPCKAAIDFVLASVLLVLSLPAMLLAALLVKLTNRGPAFYTQTRVGQYGRHFTIIKIRTMVDNAESLTGPRWAMPGDPRVTWVGMILRKTHLDELPQLFNVLRGDMSLIGPRPERPEFLPELEQAIPGYRNRLVVRPGVTGLAQLLLRADIDVECVRRKLTHDLYYIKQLNPWLDFRIFTGTILFTLGMPFHWACSMLAIPTSERIEGAEAPLEPIRAATIPKVAA